MKRRLLIIALVPGLLLSVVASFITSATTGTAYAANGNNILLLVGEHCHDLLDLEHNFSNIQTTPQDNSNNYYVNQCHGKNGDLGWDAFLNTNLGCSTQMYYTHDFHTDPADASVVTSKWYTHEDAYKYCYNQALDQYNLLAGSTCATVKKGSDNWNKCQDAQNKLAAALGCDSKMFQDLNDGHDHWAIRPGVLSSCQQQIAAVGNVQIVVIGADGQPAPDPNPVSSSSITAAPPGGAAGAAGPGGAAGVNCDSSGFNLSWIICPVINGLQQVVSGLNDEIDSLLAVGTTSTSTDQPTQIFCPGTQTGTCGSYYTAWSSFRDLALGLMVIAGLVMIMSQALGMELLDAYTIRKVLPRLLISAVAITLSWQLMEFLVTLSNDLGYGIGYIIKHPFSGIIGHFSLGGTNGLWTDLLGAAAITALGIMGLLSFVATAAIAVIIAFLTLIVRQLVVIMLVLISPIAIVAYILPNTQRFYKLWRDVFSKTLLMFPLIAGFIAGGRVLAAVALQTNGLTQQIIALIAYFGPYFAIPMTFRFSGGIMSSVGNAINSRGESGRNFLRQNRANRAKQRIERARAGTLWREDFGQFTNPFTGKQHSLGHIGNRAAINLWDQDELIPHRLGKYGVPGFKRGRYVAESQILDKKMEHNMNAFQALQKAGGIHYSTGRAMSGSLNHLVNDNNRADLERMFAVKDSNGVVQKDDEGQTVWRAPTGTMELVKMADILEKDGTSKGTLAAQELKADAGTLGSLRGTDMHRADLQTIGLYATAAQGRTEMNDLTRIYNDKAKGNPHEAARVIGVAQDLAKGQRPSQRRGHGLAFRRGADGNVTAYSVYDDPNSAEAIGSVMSMHPNEIASAKSEDVMAIADTIKATASLTKMQYNENHELVDTGIEKTGEDKLKAQAMRQKFLQIAGPYGYSDAGGAAELKKIESSLKFSDDEKRAHRSGFDPEDPALRGGGGAPEGPGAEPNPPA